MNKIEQLYPQPIAYSYGRILRAENDVIKLDQILRCAEVITRYLAAVAIASFAAREDTDYHPPKEYQEFSGNLSFGHFLTVVHRTAGANTNHPLKPLFQKHLRYNKPAVQNLSGLLTLRNKIGHDLTGLQKNVAIKILRDDDPSQKLEDILLGLEPLFSYPLFTIEKQWPDKKIPHARRLRLMGQGEPMPDEVVLSDFFMEEGSVFLACPNGILSLYPTLIWDLEQYRATNGIYVLHQIDTNLGYRSLIMDERPSNPPDSNYLKDILQGKSVPLEEVQLQDGRSLWQEWQDARTKRLMNLNEDSQQIPWADFNHQTVRWYTDLLQRHQKSDIPNAHHLIREYLLDGRGDVTREEVQQLMLLFGERQKIRQLIGRDVVDLRARLTPETSRWDERLELTENILTVLQKSIKFISEYHPAFGKTALDDLQPTTGSTDYIAVREALVNLIIHQGYEDQRTVAQIELEPNRTTMTNAGYSLASDEELRDGGTSTARNPLIARALKLIGFAELGGSGLRETYRVWRQAKRQPVIISSDKEHNRFRIVLDSRPFEMVVDTIWKEKLGASVSLDEGKILSLLGSAVDGLTLSELCTGTGFRSRDIEKMCQRLAHQQLLEKTEYQYQLKAHLVEFAQQHLQD